MAATSRTFYASCHGHTKGDAIAMKELIEQYQTDYYKRTV